MRCSGRLPVALLAGALLALPALAREPVPLVEATIGELHAAMAAGRLTARDLVARSLARIEAYDKQGPAVNAIITVNSRALARAAALDRRYEDEGLTGPLHGIPVIVKDNYDTADMPTTAGSLSLADSIPPDDAFQVRRLREAGAVVIAKSNLYEFAFSPYETVGSALPGHTRNPYALNRVPAGSSGGTAAAVAASFGVVGLGTDTGNSIRGPSSHTALVGLRPTLGLTSRDGIVPLFLDHDVGGPMTRAVADAAIVLGVIAGYDPADPATIAAVDVAAGDYTTYLDPDGLVGARLGVVRQLSDRDGADPRVLALFEAALDELRAGGATIVDPVVIPELDGLVPPVAGEQLPVWCQRFRTDLEAYLATLGEAAPVRTLADIIESGRFHPQVEADLVELQAEPPPGVNPQCAAAESGRRRLTDSVSEAFEAGALDALVFPTWSNPPRLIGDLNSPHGNNSQHIAPHTGFPAITVPMGMVDATLPAGLQFVAPAFGEPALIRLAYAYEQRTRHRRPPPTTPPL